MASMSVKVTISLSVRPDSKEVSAVFGEVFRRRGYVVIVTRPGAKYELGTRLKNLWGYDTRRAFVVSEFTTRQDCERQASLIAEIKKGDWTRTGEKYPEGATFYRVIPADEKQTQKGLNGSSRTTRRRRLLP